MRALVLMLLSFPAFAGEVILSCTDPVENEDGTPLTDLQGIKVYQGANTGGPYVEVADTTDCDSIPILTRPAGTYYYVGTAYNTAGVESRYSNEVEKVITTAPNPPILTVDANTVAYAIQQVVTDGMQSLVIYPVALVDAEAECDPHIKVSNAAHPNGLSLIQKIDVTFAPGADANTVYAECGGA